MEKHQKKLSDFRGMRIALTRGTEVMPVSESGNEMKVYLLAREEVEKLLADKYGKKLTAVNHAKLAKQNERQANWLKQAR